MFRKTYPSTDIMMGFAIRYIVHKAKAKTNILLSLNATPWQQSSLQLLISQAIGR
jgi:hypothetical protein